jgi:two-component system phosphate regulon sensor histidine kinase PhoR
MFWRLFATLILLQLLLIGIAGAVLAGSEIPGGIGAFVAKLVALSVLPALIFAYWLSRHISTPLRELVQAAERISAGDLNQRVFVDSQDEIATLARVFNHMSERLMAQFAELEEDRQQLRTILSAMVEGVVALDAEERILFANERAAQLLALHATQAVGRRLWETVRQSTLQDVVRRALQGTGPSHGEFTAEGGSGKNLTIHAMALPGQPPRGAVLVLHDTTELRRLERVRQEFVANVSHELKTPLSVITACVETLLDGSEHDAAHLHRFLEQISEQAQRLHTLILDLLSLARIETGTEVFTFESVRLDSVVCDCLDAHRALAEAKNLSLEAVEPGSAWEISDRSEAVASLASTTETAASVVVRGGVVAWADDESVRQIVDNLVDNAIKYTPAGGRIWVRWRAEDNEVVIEVEDTGIGIPDRDLPRIFERFYRADRARSRELGGTGLGLSIVKHLVQSMHGSVRATSRLGLGTMFHLRLPRAPEP